MSLLAVAFLSNHSHSQEICMVSADFTNGEDYIVFWEQPADISNLDSVIIYRQQGQETVFTRVGAVEVGPTLPTKFTDSNANTMDTTKYSIAFKTTVGVELPMSPWHQAVVYDYSGQGNGIWIWTAYKKEGQVDPSYITEYRCMLQMPGAPYVNIGSMSNTTLSWTDANWASHTDGFYVIETELPTCTINEKANINTSRSNIKQQITNAEAGINESSLKGTMFTFANNPVQSDLLVEFEQEMQQAKVWVSSVNGQQVSRITVTGKSVQLNVSDLSQGVYLFNVEVNGVITTKRFVKQ